MPKTLAERVRAAEKKHRDRGEREIRVWSPDVPGAIDKIRKLAVRLCREYATRREVE